MGQTLFPQSTPDWLLTRGVLPRRLIAVVLDCILITLLGGVATFLVTLLGILTLGLGWLALHVLPWLPLFYYTILIGSVGATPGQRACGIAVRQDADLAPPTMAQALVWTVLLWVSFALGCIPFLLALVGPRHRAAHDLLSGLVLVRTP
jgi:uncharacterized RDD family membrane protein YckC